MTPFAFALGTFQETLLALLVRQFFQRRQLGLGSLRLELRSGPYKAIEGYKYHNPRSHPILLRLAAVHRQSYGTAHR